MKAYFDFFMAILHSPQMIYILQLQRLLLLVEYRGSQSNCFKADDDLWDTAGNFHMSVYPSVPTSIRTAIHTSPRRAGRASEGLR